MRELVELTMRVYKTLYRRDPDLAARFLQDLKDRTGYVPVGSRLNNRR